jgi:hypothetical protein
MDMLRIPSVSADSKYKEDVQRNAEFVKNSFGVYSNSFDKNYCYIIKKSPHIQK